MIRIIFEPKIPSAHIKDEVWYPEINKNIDECYDYLYHEAGRSKGLTVITYSIFVLECLEIISKVRKIEIQVELRNGKVYNDNFEDIYEMYVISNQRLDNIKWDLEDKEI